VALSIEEANAELKRVKKKPDSYLRLSGPDDMTRVINAIPPGLPPGVYKFAWVEKGDDGADVIPVSGSLQIDPDPEPTEDAQQFSDPRDIMFFQLMNEFKKSQSVQVDRDRLYYEKMLELNKNANASLDEDRRKLMDTFQETTKSFMKGISEQLKNMPTQVLPPETDFWTELMKEHGDKLLPMLMPFVTQILGKMAAVDITPAAPTP
jgi:hypothetical protein